MPNITNASKKGNNQTISDSHTGALGGGLEYRTRLNLYPHLSNFAIWSSGVVNTTRRTLGMPISSAQNIGTFPSTALTLSIASTSANDLGITGSGARTITIRGLDENFEPLTESDITLNGQTPVTTSNTFIRVNRIFVDETGSFEANEGDVFISDSSDSFVNGIPQSRVYCAMIAGENNDTYGHFSTGKHTTLYLVKGNHYNNALGDTPILVEERYRSPNFAGGFTNYSSGALWYTRGVSYNFDGAGPILGPTDLQWIATSSSGTREATVYYESCLRNDLLDFDNVFPFTQNPNVFG